MAIPCRGLIQTNAKGFSFADQLHVEIARRDQNAVRLHCIPVRGLFYFEGAKLIHSLGKRGRENGRNVLNNDHTGDAVGEVSE